MRGQGGSLRRWGTGALALALLAVASCAAGASDDGAGHPAVAPAGWGDGLADAALGYRLVSSRGAGEQLSFRLVVPESQPGAVATWFWSKDLHYFARSDAEQRRDGSWWANFGDLPGGPGHLVVAFPTGDRKIGELVLGADVVVPGSSPGQAGLAPTHDEMQQVDGYDVTLAGDLLLAQESELDVTVRDGEKTLDPRKLEVAAVSLDSGAFVRFDTGVNGQVTGVPSSPGRFHVFVDVRTPRGPLRATFLRDVFG